MHTINRQINLIQKTISTIGNEAHNHVIEVLSWFNTFLGYEFFAQENMNIMKQGDIYEINLGKNIGSELNKRRPCIIISGNPFNQGNTILIAPLKSIKPYTILGPITPALDINNTNLNKESFVAISNIREISKKRIGTKIGKLDRANIEKVKEALSIIFGIKKRPR